MKDVFKKYLSRETSGYDYYNVEKQYTQESSFQNKNIICFDFEEIDNEYVFTFFGFEISKVSTIGAQALVFCEENSDFFNIFKRTLNTKQLNKIQKYNDVYLNKELISNIIMTFYRELSLSNDFNYENYLMDRTDNFYESAVLDVILREVNSGKNSIQIGDYTFNYTPNIKESIEKVFVSVNRI